MIKASIKMIGAFLMPKFRKGGAYASLLNIQQLEMLLEQNTEQ